MSMGDSIMKIAVCGMALAGACYFFAISIGPAISAGEILIWLLTYGDTSISSDYSSTNWPFFTWLIAIGVGFGMIENNNTDD